MAMNPVIPFRRKVQSGTGESVELLAALADAAQAHAEGQVLSGYVERRFGLPCVVLARASKGWVVAGAAALPDGMRLHVGTHVSSSVDPERWLREMTTERWVRRDLSHGRRVVARLLVRADTMSEDLQRVCMVAAPVLAAAYPRQPGASPLELYLAQIVHDLRQPLSTLRLAHSLLREASSGDATLLDRCQRAVVDLSELMDDLLAFAGPQGSTKKRGQVPVRLRQLAEQVIEDHQAHARFREVTLALDARADPTILGQPLGLKRALVNLIDNALVHAPPGTLVEVVLDVDYQSTFLEVRDQGPGVPGGLRELVFEPFFTTRSNGNGLGLAVVRLVAQQHGGQARFLDTDEGAIVRISLPHQPSANIIPL